MDTVLTEVYFSLGSNLGDRESNIEQALLLMDRAFGVHYTRLSGIIETESWGFQADSFLNCAVLYRLPEDMDPEEILSSCKAIERSLGRTDAPEYAADGSRVYHSRTIDIDILLIGTREIKTKTLTVPHPLMFQRPFVMEPLLEIAEDSLILQDFLRSKKDKS